MARLRTEAALAGGLLLAVMAAVTTACTYQDVSPATLARALLQQQALNDSLVALTPAVPSITPVLRAPRPAPREPVSRTAPWPQPPRARQITARVGHVKQGGLTVGVASSTTVAAQQGFWRRGNVIYADKVYLTQNAGARDLAGYKTAFVAAGEDLTVYAADVRTDDLALPGRNVTIVAHSVSCAQCTSSSACGCTIDVSGLPGLSRDGKAANGRDGGGFGKPGEPGGDGAAGGSITLRLPASAELAPAGSFYLELAARGGPGGFGQEGGDGAQGAKGATAGSTCSSAWDKNPGRIGFTGYCKDKESEGIDRRGYIGATGNRGGNGGNGGDNGFNGQGGAGGTVRVIAQESLSTDVLRMAVNGGAGGQRPDNKFGAKGQYGTGGGGGPGAYYLIDRKYSNAFACWPNPCCCYEKSIAQGCNGVTCKNLYDNGWLGFTGSSDIANTITVLVAQLNSGLDYYGNRPSFVPSLSLGTLQAYTCNTLLPLMQTLESSINSYQRASEDAEARKNAAFLAIQDMQSKLESMKDDLDQARTEREKLYSQQALLRAQRDGLRTELDRAIGAFEQAISDKIREEASKGSVWELLLDSFTDVLDLIGQMQKVASKGEMDALGKAIKDGKDIYEKWDAFLQPLPAPLNIDAIAVADSLSQVQGTFGDWSKFNATASKDRRKQAMLKEQWEKLISNYTTLKTGEQYQLMLAAYDDACGAYNQLLFVIDCKTLTIVQAEQTIQALGAQLPQLRNNLDQLMAQDEPWVAQFLYRAYEIAKSAILRNLFQQAAASNFMYGAAECFTVQDTSYNGLLAKSADLQEDIFKQLQSTNPSTPTTFVRIVLNNRTVPGFTAGLKGSRIDFQLSPCLPSFYAYASVFVQEFRVRFIGAVAKPGFSDAALTVGLSTPGTSIVRGAGPQLSLFPFVMTPRQSDFFYYLNEDPWTKRDPGYFVSDAVPPTATCAPLGKTESVYSPLSPLAPWSLSFPPTGTNAEVDFSKVTSVQIEFRGSKVAPSPGGEAALDSYCAGRGFARLLGGVQRVVSDVEFIAGRDCPTGTALVGGNLNAGLLGSRPVYMCVATALATTSPTVVSDVMLVHNSSSLQQTRCPDGFDRAGVDLNMGVQGSAIAACVRKGSPAGRMISALRIVRNAAQCTDGELVGNANQGTRGPGIFLCMVPARAIAG